MDNKKLVASLAGVGGIIAGLALLLRKPSEAPSISITSYHYVYQGVYTWDLSGGMIHGQDITHIGFNFKNDKAETIPGISVIGMVEWDDYYVTILGQDYLYNGESRLLSIPLDQYKNAIDQPFVLEPSATMGIWFDFTPPAELHETELGSGVFEWQGPPSCKLTAQVWVGEKLIKSRALTFDVSYS